MAIIRSPRRLAGRHDGTAAKKVLSQFVVEHAYPIRV
jgi:hypothetical protein